jgi:DNA-binding response OmpR family regulator
MLIKKILIVEDDNKITAELTNMIRKMDYDVSSVKVSNKLGLKSASDDNPDLILIDGKYHVNNGICDIVIDILKKLNVPVIYVNSDEDNVLQNMVPTDITDQIYWPIEERKLNIAIEIALYRHNMELRILESEARFKSLVENSSIGIFRLSREGRILHGNPTFLKLLGCNNLKEIIGTNL